MNMTPKQVYLEAARLAAENEFGGDIGSCSLVYYVGCESHYGNPEFLSQRYGEVFHPTGDTCSFSRKMQRIPKKNGERDNLRVLMLTLMAACWKDFR